MVVDHVDAGRTSYRLGLVLVLLSALLFSLSGVFTKAITAGAWTILTWRGLIGALLIYVYARSRGDATRLGWRGWALAAVGSISSVTFIWAFKMTYVANVTVIYAMVPFVAAWLEWALLKERVRRDTMLAAVVCTLGIGILVWGAVGSPSLAGDMVAVAMMLLNAIYLVMIRVFKATPVVLAGALAALQLFVVGWFFTDPLAVSANDAVWIALFGVVFAGAAILWTEGAKRVTAAEVGLLGSADVPMAILFAWVLLAEVPPVASMVGGGLVLAAVFAYSWRRAASPSSA